jgi:uncharacterized protein DUF1501
MLTLLGNPRRFCDGLTRRESLTAGGLALLGGMFGLPQWAAGEEERLVKKSGKAKSVIVLFLHGGAATQDMYDLKPDAPAEVRGEFKPIATIASGVQICEHLPLTAKWMHKAAIVRTVNHKAGCHNPLAAFTGLEIPVPEQNKANPNHPPSMGSVCEYVRRDSNNMPAYVCLPHHLGWGELGRRPGIYGGFLGATYDPLCGECDATTDAGKPTKDRAHPPEVRGEPRMPNSILQDGITIDRLGSRKNMVELLNDQLRLADSPRVFDTYGSLRQRAFSLLTSAELKAAFNLEAEDAKLRDRYGRSLFGSSTLVARKMVEAGVKFVNVFWDNYAPRLGITDFGWDTHEVNFITLKDHYLPWLDRTYTGLLEDMEHRGLLDETLVVVMSDFGRTPRINATAGRDHWSYCYSVLLAGAGIRGGSIHGASDSQAAFPRDKPVSTGDICATIYKCLGINPEMLIQDRSGRPWPIANGGKAIEEILA